MAWKINFTKKAEKQFAKLTPEVQRRTAGYLSQRVACQPDPRKLGKALTGPIKVYGGTGWRITGFSAISAIENPWSSFSIWITARKSTTRKQDAAQE